MFIVFLMDDVGWFDMGFNGGGISVGSATLIIDNIVSQDSAYS